MKASRFSEAQKAFILKQGADGMPVADICRKAGISVTLDFSRPRKPTDNAVIEAFNGRFRAECLNAHWFMSLADAHEKLEDWRKYYNEGRPTGQSTR